MRNILLVAVICIFGLASSLYAEETSKRAMAEELLNLMQVQKNLEKTYEMIKQMQIQQIKQLGMTKGDPTEKTEAMIQKVMDLMSQEMSWDKMKGDYITIYEETFTREELSGMIEFYKSPVGQKSIEKQPELMEKSMQVSKKKMGELMPRVESLIQEMYQEPEASELIPGKQGSESQ